MRICRASAEISCPRRVDPGRTGAPKTHRGIPPMAKTRDDPKKSFRINEKIWKNPRLRALMTWMNPRTPFRISAAWDHPTSYLDEPNPKIGHWTARTWHGRPFGGLRAGLDRNQTRAAPSRGCLGRSPCHLEPNRVQILRFEATRFLRTRERNSERAHEATGTYCWEELILECGRFLPLWKAPACGRARARKQASEPESGSKLPHSKRACR